MEAPNRIYIVTTDFVIDCLPEDLQIKAFNNKEDAKKYFSYLVDENRRLIDEFAWEVEVDEDWLFRAGKEYYYTESHIEIMITETKVE